MPNDINYFEVTSYLADIEAEFADVKDPVKRTQSLVERLLRKWPSMTADQAVAYVQVFTKTN